MTDATHTVEMGSPPDDVNTVHGLLESVWADAPGVAVKDQLSFETALIELTSNVFSHANAGSGVSCTLTVTACADRLEARLSDSGVPSSVELFAGMPDELSESGRGIPMIRLLVDELDYTRAGNRNEWRITRRIDS